MHSFPDFDSGDVVRDRILAAADGYAELGLTDLAWKELESLTSQDRQRADAGEVILSLLVRQKRWEEAIEAGRRLLNHGDRRAAVFIHTAFALHEAKRTAEAKATLLQGPQALRDDPLFHYNLACYLAAEGAMKDAEVALRTALKMDGKLRRHALKDADLKAFHDVL